MNDSFFKRLDAAEERDFRQWARDNFDPNKEADSCWHPCVRDEWQKMARNDVGFFYFEAQTGTMQSKRSAVVSNYYVYRLPNLMTGTVQNEVEKAEPTDCGLQYRDTRNFLAELSEYDTEEKLT